jgi:glucokinase
MTPPRSLIADIGGTNARFAMVDQGGKIGVPGTLACADFPGPTAAARAYIEATAAKERPLRGAFAVASPVTGDAIDMTNHPWTFSIDVVRRELGLERLDVINDFTAVALSVPHLGNGGRRRVGGGEALPGAPIAVIGPGTGLGVSGLVPSAEGWLPLATEGGHVSLAAMTDREEAVIAILRRNFGHASAERAVSGPGLVNLYNALAELEGVEVASPTPATITERAGNCPRSRDALALFTAFLGTVASDLALSLGARGGVYMAGGILPKLGGTFDEKSFRARFEDKGRFCGYLASIPTYIITHEHPAFLGLAGMVTET